MLTTKKLSLGQASTYYSKDNYYTQERGEYFGKLTSDLGLNNLTHESYIQLLNGINPSTGESLVPSKKNKKTNVPAFDFTFSPTKSLSISYELAVAKGDTVLAASILKVHDNAVNAALSHIQDEHIKTKVQTKGKRVSVNTGNLLAAKFEHDINRNLEPQLHTHSVIYNFTKGEDGKFRSIDATNFLKKGSPIIKNLGKFYRESLRVELQSAGFELRDTDRSNSFFELKHISHELIQAFSSRSQDIKSKVIELKKEFPKLSEAQLSERAFFNTRVSKKDVNRDAVRDKNIELMSKYVDVDKLLSQIQPNKQSVDFKKEPVLEKVDEIKLKKLIRTAQKELKKWQRVPLNVASSVLASLPATSKINMKDLYTKVKTQQQEEHKVLNTMHEVLVFNLKETKLDVKKLYSSLYSLKSLDKHQLEEKIENGRRSHRNKFITSHCELSATNSGAEQTHDRDVRNVNQNIDTKPERRDSGTDTQRDDTFISGKSRDDNKPVVVTIDDLRLADSGYRESQKLKNQSKGISD